MSLLEWTLLTVATAMCIAWLQVRRRAMHAEAKAEELAGVVEFAPDAVLLVDQDGQIELVNAQTEALFGYKRDALIGQSLEVLMPAERRQAHAAHRRAFIEQPRTRGMGGGLDLVGLTADGRVFPIDVNLSVADYGGRRVAAAVRDIAAQKEVESQLILAKAEAERAADMRSRFLAAASHDLRQPLQSLSMYQALLLRSPPQQQHSVAQRMGRSLDAMSELLDALLDVSKLDAGAVEAQLDELLLDPILHRIGTGSAPDRHRIGTGAAVLIDAKPVRVEVHPSTAVVRSDPALLSRIVENLVGNAVRYTEAGSVTLGVRKLNQEEVAIEVADTGIGIPGSALEAIFEEYTQLHNEARDRARGLGSGLAVVKRMAHLLGHRIEVRSELGRGSTFSVVVPLVGEQANSQPQTAMPLAVRHPGNLVLLVEDAAGVPDATTALLESAGFVVHSCADGEQARRAVAIGVCSLELLI